MSKSSQSSTPSPSKAKAKAEAEAPDPVAAFLDAASFDLGWSLIERFSILVRESGSLDERTAARFITSRLETLGIPHEVHEPELYLSIPREGAVEAGDRRFEGKPSAFSRSTPGDGLSAPAVYVSAAAAQGLAGTEDQPAEDLPDLAGKIAVTDGFPVAASVARMEEAGALGQIYVNPGSRVHWSSCTRIWGTPGESQAADLPKTPVVAINRPDGDALAAAVGEGLENVTLRAKLDETWRPCLLPVAHVHGQQEEYVLAHGHYDSWDVGIGDNAVGDATLLELARVFHENRGLLRRSLKVAWWPGHSTGCYGGSAWYADRFAIDLLRYCVATVNVDSPGCWQATEYDEVAWMAEAGAVCRNAVRAVAGKTPVRQRPPRAGDYSFNQLGLSSFFMLLSNMPADERARLGFYPVGGCGGNIAWHTEKDRIGIADRDNLVRDLKVYSHAIGRFLVDEIVPLDFRETAGELNAALAEYEAALGKRVNLKPLRMEFNAMVQRIDALYARIEKGGADPNRVNNVLLRLGRALVPLNYSVGGRFEHDPALPSRPLPKLARALEVPAMEESAPERVPFVLSDLQRQANKVAFLISEARQALAEDLGKAKTK